MITCQWEAIAKFDGWSEYDRFVAWMAAQMASDLADEVPVASSYNPVCGYEERWYRHRNSGMVWRLVKPEPPFGGLFALVD
jgi:hypothetical protein